MGMSVNLKQLLIAKNDWFAEQIMEGVRGSEYGFITPAQSRLLAHMGGKPINMAELSRKLGISRQAVHKTVAELARRGILQLQEDPDRGNSKLVVYTDKGMQVNSVGVAIIESIEIQISRKIGVRPLEQLKELLSKI
jgi:DNA-binding MarR family transcriptional regulator